MTAELAQMVTAIAAFDLGTGPDMSCFPLEFVEWVRTELWEPDAPAPAETLGSIADWAARRRQRGIEQLSLLIPGINLRGDLPDRRMLGQINTSGAYVLGVGPVNERWRMLWRVGNQQAPDRRVWQILYQGVDVGPVPAGTPRPPINDEAEIARVTAALITALQNNHRFAVANGFEPWPAAFELALHIATSAPEPPTPAGAQYGVFLPPGWRSPAARRLIRAAMASSVFRGQASWSDLPLRSAEQAAEYERIAQPLMIAMLQGIAVGTNSR